MLDWNGNGKIDPVDIGISIATEQNDAERERPPKRGGGCLTSSLMLISLVAFTGIIIG